MDDAIARTTQRFAVDGECAEADDWGALLVDWARRQQTDTIVTAYAPTGTVGDLLDYAKVALANDGVRLLQLRRDYDTVAWPHASRGYFKMKEQIPAVLGALGIVTQHIGPDAETV